MAGLGEGESDLCVICTHDPSLLAAYNLNSKRGMMSFPVCGNHSKEDIDRMMKNFEMELDKLGIETKEQDSTDQSSRIRTYNFSSLANGQQLFPAAASSQKLKTQSSIPLTSADFIVQNLPPGDSLTSSGGFDLRDAEKLVDVAYAWGQLEVASSALTNAYERLKTIDEQRLPARSLRQRMEEIQASGERS